MALAIPCQIALARRGDFDIFKAQSGVRVTIKKILMCFLFEVSYLFISGAICCSLKKIVF